MGPKNIIWRDFTFIVDKSVSCILSKTLSGPLSLPTLTLLMPGKVEGTISSLLTTIGTTINYLFNFCEKVTFSAHK